MRLLFTALCLLQSLLLLGQQSVARPWNELLLESIRNDQSRPTVHARNLFHVSAAMYDAWSVFSDDDHTYLLGKNVHGFESAFDGFPVIPDKSIQQQKEAVSYAAYRLIRFRFGNSPGRDLIYRKADSLFEQALGFDPYITSTHYSRGSAAALGNYIAQQYIDYGMQDGSNEANDFANRYYQPVNPPLTIQEPGNPLIVDPNRWQPLRFKPGIDAEGNVVPGGVRDFLSAEWGWVNPFSLSHEDKKIVKRDGHDYALFLDPGAPPYLDTTSENQQDDYFRWNFELVAVWSAHLDPQVDVLLDISPASLGNLDMGDFPTVFNNYNQFYDFFDGADPSKGHMYNPFTGRRYEPEIVKLGDYARVLAEFWADGPDSETPPGHWFTILNDVLDHPQFRRQVGGSGLVLDPLEYDVKAYFILGGAMHDVAVACWSVKGYYDFVRPVSAIRYLAGKGQSSDPELPSYHPAGIRLIDGFIELVGSEDPLAGDDLENVGKIKLKTWRGPDFVKDPGTDVAGVGWIVAENWWPYQSPTFVTPPFAGYVSGHSTYSRAAAEVLTRLTGDAFFPGGIAEFYAKKDEFLTFEKGPSTDIILQWATYRDAADQSSLSRIWGGIHPPADDIPGRFMGEKIGNQAFEYALSYFSPSTVTSVKKTVQIELYPNPASGILNIKAPSPAGQIQVRDMMGKVVLVDYFSKSVWSIDVSSLAAGKYLVTVIGGDYRISEILLKR